jgi:hypothetical protein
MKLREAGGSPLKHPVPKVFKSRVLYLWVYDYCDGPREGLAKYNDEYVWFKYAEEAFEVETTTWRYWVVRLTEEQLREISEMREDYCRNAADQGGYGVVGKPARFREVDPEEVTAVVHHRCDDRLVDLSDNEVIAWYETKY